MGFLDKMASKASYRIENNAGRAVEKGVDKAMDPKNLKKKNETSKEKEKEQKCPKCGNVNKGMNFCGKCGANLNPEDNAEE